MKIVIVIPTWNERENISRLIGELRRQPFDPGHDMNILVVDDNSQDKTADVVKEFRREDPGIHLLQGEKKGLGNAYIRGMTYALDVLKADAVLEMDADLSHKPADVPRLLRALDDGADFVIGSRYVSGGSIPREWGLLRKMNSRCGNMLARYLGGLSAIRDCTAGFRAIRSTLLRKIALSDIKAQGYAFQVTLLYEAVLRQARVREIPVDFVDRTQGESKLGISDIIEFAVNVACLRFRDSTTFIKFLIVGASGVIVNLGLLSLLLRSGVNKFAASPIAIAVSIVSNFALNNAWTFRKRPTQDSLYIKSLKFYTVSLLALGLSYGTFVLLTLLFPDTPPQWNQFMGILPATLVNYLLNSRWTFKKK